VRDGGSTLRTTCTKSGPDERRDMSECRTSYGEKMSRPHTKWSVYPVLPSETEPPGDVTTFGPISHVLLTLWLACGFLRLSSISKLAKVSKQWLATAQRVNVGLWLLKWNSARDKIEELTRMVQRLWYIPTFYPCCFPQSNSGHASAAVFSPFTDLTVGLVTPYCSSQRRSAVQLQLLWWWKSKKRLQNHLAVLSGPR